MPSHPVTTSCFYGQIHLYLEGKSFSGEVGQESRVVRLTVTALYRLKSVHAVPAKCIHEQVGEVLCSPHRVSSCQRVLGGSSSCSLGLTPSRRSAAPSQPQTAQKIRSAKPQNLQAEPLKKSKPCFFCFDE